MIHCLLEKLNIYCRHLFENFFLEKRFDYLTPSGCQFENFLKLSLYSSLNSRQSTQIVSTGNIDTEPQEQTQVEGKGLF